MKMGISQIVLESEEPPGQERGEFTTEKEYLR
jgi:hypothetical protein